MRSANSDGSWETAKDEKFLTVRIDKVQCGKKDGFAFGKVSLPYVEATTSLTLL